MIREDIKQHLEDWDSGKAIKTVEMGGLGVAYEMAIQRLTIALLRLDGNINDDLTKVLENDQYEFGGYSGAMINAASSLALNLRDRGLEALKDDVIKDRLLLINKQGQINKILVIKGEKPDAHI